ncbi:MAG: flagellar hook-length control protein FliK, partial [Micrococcales bacterium]|nr:flagellar hook-length control protein FliK [Micrococcales bacterium]
TVPAGTTAPATTQAGPAGPPPAAASVAVDPAGPGAAPAAATAAPAGGSAPAPTALTGAAQPSAGSAASGTAAAATDPAGDTPAPAPAPTAPAALQVGTVQHRAPVAAAPAAGVPLSDQIAAKLGEQLPALRSLGGGSHVLTLRVDPEHFGPVTVVAHISPESVRVELVGATDSARDALRQSLPDLRRDLASTGLSSDVSLGGGDASGATGGETRRDSLAGARPLGAAPAGTAPGPATDLPAARPSTAAGGLDLLV